MRLLTSFYSILTLIFFISKAQKTIAYPYDIKHSFCLDYASNNTSIYDNMLNYNFRKEYKSCMRNANDMIDAYENENYYFCDNFMMIISRNS